MKKNPVSLLPDGSVLKGVLLPRYDKERKLVGDMKAETMRLGENKQVHGENVRIRFFNSDRSLRGKVDMKNVLFDQVTSRIFANEPVEITTDRLIAKGEGLVYSLQEGEGFLKGPASTRISAPPTATSMNSKPITAAALIALCLAPSPLVAAPPAFVSEEELAALKADAASTKPEADKILAATEKSFNESVDQGNKASAAALEFISKSEIKNIAVEEPAAQAEAKPLEVNPGPDDTVITCEGGMYFDSDEGVLVYLKNVKVTDPRFNLSGVNELKVFFEKKPDKKPDKKEANAKDQKPAGMGNFGDVQKIIAEGAVLIDQKPVDGKEPVQASGQILTYNIATGEIIIHGGFAWVKQGQDFYARAKERDLSLRLLKNGDFTLTPGNWEFGGNMKLKDK